MVGWEITAVAIGVILVLILLLMLRRRGTELLDNDLLRGGHGKMMKKYMGGV